VIQQLVAVFFVMGLLLVSLQRLRHRGLAGFGSGVRLRRSNRQLQVVEKLPLTPQHSLHVVRMGHRSLLIAASPSGCALLKSWKSEARTGGTV
jgi:flagellar biogenesis protein FliO